tara:strand:+ start:558 stop:926 length:369 start_codon:yes stop_codon:yes gene_type:complete
MKADIKELMDEKLMDGNNEYGYTFGDAWELYEHLDYSGGVHEIIDSSIDIYYYDLRKWAVDNYQFIEDAIAEGMWERGGRPTDYYKLIQAGQYMRLREDAERYVEELYAEHDGIAFNVEVTA